MARVFAPSRTSLAFALPLTLHSNYGESESVLQTPPTRRFLAPRPPQAQNRPCHSGVCGARFRPFPHLACVCAATHFTFCCTWNAVKHQTAARRVAEAPKPHPHSLPCHCLVAALSLPCHCLVASCRDEYLPVPLLTCPQPVICVVWRSSVLCKHAQVAECLDSASAAAGTPTGRCLDADWTLTGRRWATRPYLAHTRAGQSHGPVPTVVLSDPSQRCRSAS